MDMASLPCWQHMGASRRQIAQLDCITKLIADVALEWQRPFTMAFLCWQRVGASIWQACFKHLCVRDGEA